MNVGLLLAVAIFVPGLAALASLLVPAGRESVFRRLAVLSTSISFAACLGVFAAYSSGAAPVDPDGFACGLRAAWLPSIGASFHLGVDGTSVTLLLLAGLVNLAGVLAGGAVAARPKEYYALYQLLATGALLAIGSLDLLLFYVALEADVLCSFVLIAGWGKLPAGGRSLTFAAMLLTLALAAGALLAMVGFWLLAHAGGSTFDLPALLAHMTANPLPVSVQRPLFLLLFAGFGILLSIWPLHVWAPLGYAAAPTGVSMISVGVLKSLAAYGLLRIAIPLLPDGAASASGLMAGLAAANVLYGGWIAMRQTDWKLLLAYSSISHMGYVLMGLAAGNGAGRTGAVVILFAHGLSAAAGFALVGDVESRTGTRSVASLSGLARSLPFTGPAMVVAVLAICGLPGFAGFWGEILALAGAWQEGSMPFRVAATSGAIGLILTATYMLAALRTSFFGPARVDAEPAPATSCGFRLACVLLLAASMIVGFAPRLVTDLIQSRGSANPAATEDR